MKTLHAGWRTGAAALALGLALAGPAFAGNRDREEMKEKWIAGDFHQHSYFTDGSNQIDKVMSNGYAFDLDFQANSEHGGLQGRDGYGRNWNDTGVYPTLPSIGDPTGGRMWRWQSLLRTSDIPGYAGPAYLGAYDWLLGIREDFPDKATMTGMEWNIPGHEHGSTGIARKNALPIAEFEYRFDQSDTDGTVTTVTADTMGWPGKRQNGEYTVAYPLLGLNPLHEKAIDGIKWMQKHYPRSGWIVPAHVERRGCGGVGNNGYTAAAFRDMNDNGPTVAFGFEGMPGHQKSVQRGEFGGSSCGGGTYGGAGIYVAQVGGLWDALLGEGRGFYNFASSDFHGTGNDFWPGEYQKTYVKAKVSGRHGEIRQEDVVAGLRSGNSFAVHGDLIEELDFRVAPHSRHCGDDATMGETLKVRKGEKVEVKIRFKSPAANNCRPGVNASAGFNCQAYPPVVHHVQLIQGRFGNDRPAKFLADGSENPAFAENTNPTASIVKTFDAASWTVDRKGYATMTFVVPKMEANTYFRIRGTNKGYNEAGETDPNGSPLIDVPGNNSADEAWKDLWFYSNPIFVKVQ
ncbi:MAG: hypothetical protein AB1346_07350 [Thermodesulfobacteriota bacterium]